MLQDREDQSILCTGESVLEKQKTQRRLSNTLLMWLRPSQRVLHTRPPRTMEASTLENWNSSCSRLIPSWKPLAMPKQSRMTTPQDLASSSESTSMLVATLLAPT